MTDKMNNEQLYKAYERIICKENYYVNDGDVEILIKLGNMGHTGSQESLGNIYSQVCYSLITNSRCSPYHYINDGKRNWEEAFKWYSKCAKKKIIEHYL